jgi:hypothetical protein
MFAPCAQAKNMGLSMELDEPQGVHARTTHVKIWTQVTPVRFA